MGIGGIIGIVIGVAAVVGVASFLLIKFVVLRRIYQKQVKELDRKYSYLDALMIGQDSLYIKRLEMISRTNLLYVDVYNQYSKKFKHVYDIDDQYAKGVVTQLKSLIASKQYHQIKNAILEGKKAIATFEEKAIALDQELTNLIKPEEESRQTALSLKEKLRDVKQTYSNYQTDLEPVATTFQRLFDKLDKKFLEFESLIEGAEYEEANAILPVIDQVLTQLTDVLVELPQLCVLVHHILPEKIAKIKEESETLHLKGYPLHHLMLTTEFANYEERLEVIKVNLLSLKLKAVKKDTELLQKDIESMHVNFEQEITSKNYFVTNCDSIYQKVLNIEKHFLRLCSVFPQMNRVYKISDEAQNNIEELKEGINNLGSSKRSLDSYIHSSTPQAYTILASKLETLAKDYEHVQKQITDFKIYLDSLKDSSQEAYQLVFAYYYRLKLCEEQVKLTGIDASIEKYHDRIETCYNLLNTIEETIKVVPIDIVYIDEQVEELKNTANELFDDVEKDGNIIQMAESAILIANRDRKHQNDIHEALKDCEDKFFAGEFESAYHDVVSLLKERHVADNQG